MKLSNIRLTTKHPREAKEDPSVEGILLPAIHPVKWKYRSTFSALHNRSQVSYLGDSRPRSSTLSDVVRSFSTATLFWKTAFVRPRGWPMVVSFTLLTIRLISGAYQMVENALLPDSDSILKAFHEPAGTTTSS